MNGKQCKSAGKIIFQGLLRLTFT